MTAALAAAACVSRSDATRSVDPSPSDPPTPATHEAQAAPAASESPASESAAASPEPIEAPTADAPATEPETATAPASDPSTLLVPDANLSVESVEADGQRMQQLACRAERLPLLGALAVVAGVAEQKRALDRCAPKGGAVALTWTFHDGEAEDITVRGTSSEQAGRCVAKAMRKVGAPFSARCGAIVLVGDRAGADRAASALVLEP